MITECIKYHHYINIFVNLLHSMIPEPVKYTGICEVQCDLFYA